MSGWCYLIGAIFMEVAGTTSMKLSQGFTRFMPSLFVFLFYGTAIALLTMALKTVAVSTAYAVWSGLGTALVAGIGFIIFREQLTCVKAVSILLIITGVIGLQLQSTDHSMKEEADVNEEMLLR